MNSVILLSSILLLCGVQTSSAKHKHRIARQASNYELPGRTRRADEYYSSSARKPQYEDLIEQYEPRTTSAQTYSSSPANPSDYSGQSYSQPSSSYRTRSQYPKQQTYGSSDRDRTRLTDEEAAKLAEEEENKKPDRLALLLADSKFSCGDKKDGYYADETVSCQVFHYCVSGVKHSWQCPENTVFHQIHLNCVPASQDICAQSSKFHLVNDYLHRQLDQRGPNNTIRYSQRYYPEGFSLGDPLLAPNQLPQSYGGSPNSYESDTYDEPPARPQSRAQSYKPSSYQSYPAPAPAAPKPPTASRAVYKQTAVTRPVQAYTPPSYSTISISAATPTKRPTYTTYSTPNTYGSDYGSDEESYPSSVSSYARESDYPSSAYSSPSTSYPSSAYSSNSNSQYSPSNSQYSPSSSGYASSGYSPSSSSSSALSPSSGATYAAFKPVQSVQSKPASYPNRSLGIPIASFRVASSPNYGSSPQASRIRTAAYASPSSYSLSELISGVKYDEDY